MRLQKRLGVAAELGDVADRVPLSVGSRLSTPATRFLVECDVVARHLTIVERRAPWREGLGPEWTAFPIARLRYTAVDKSWTLYWRDRNLRFRIYERLTPSRRVEDLLTEVDDDPTGIF